MSPKTARLGFTFITLISIPLSIYAVVSTANLIHFIAIHAAPILFDSSNLYFILASVFWPMALAEYTGTKEKMRWFRDILPTVLIVWFVSCIAIGALGNWALKTTLEAEGYVACKNPQSISRISRTESLIYRLDGCES